LAGKLISRSTCGPRTLLIAGRCCHVLGAYQKSCCNPPFRSAS